MTRTELIKGYEENIKEIIFDTLKYNHNNDFSTIFEDVYDTLNDEIFQMINELREVIYTYQAKEVSKVVGMYDAFDTSDITGERFDNWSQVAFENIYQLIYENIDLESLYYEVITE